MKRAISLIIVPILILVLFSGCKNTGKATSTKMMMDTVVTVSVSDTENAAALVEGAMKLCDSYSFMFDRHAKNSPIARLNAAEGKPVEVTDEIIYLAELSQRYYEQTGGMFDITIAPILDLWDFSGESDKLPNHDDIVERLSLVGSNRIVIGDGTLALKRGAAVDFGAVAKGFIADKMFEYLKNNGAVSATINLGGNVYVLTGEEKYARIGIQKPFDENGTVAAVLELSDMTAVTSGTYQRYFIKNDKLYHHIIDPHTGYPVNTDLSSVTVIGTCSAEADALSTSLLAMGYEAAHFYIESVRECEAVFIKTDGELCVSSGLELVGDAYRVVKK